MGMSIRTNISALDAQKNLMGTENDLNSSFAKLSSGFRITKAPDDAAGLAISVNLGAQIKSYNQSVRNANDALNVVQTADSSLNEIAEHPDPPARAGVAVGLLGREQHRARLHPERGRRSHQRNRSYRQRDRVQRRLAAEHRRRR